ncbi:MAG: WD40 repeat domain-containing protein, partial [Bryobacteraceae bacterium]
IWDVATGTRLYTLSDATDGINTLALDPTGTMVAAGGLDKTVRVWKLGDKDGQLLNSLIAHEDSILSLAWSPDGKTIVSSSADRTIKEINAADLTELKALPDQPDWVYAVKFSPDGKTFAAGRFDGSLSIYDSHRYNDLLEVRRAALSAPGR